MPIRTTYPDQYGGPGKVITDFGLIEETFQGYCQIPATPTAIVPLLDIDSPNPLSPTPLTITANSLTPRAYVSIIGTVQSAHGGSDIILSSAGTIKASIGLATDASQGSGAVTGACPRLSTGALISGLTIPRNSVLVGGGSVVSGFGALGSLSSNATFSIHGASSDLPSATPVNISSSVPARPAFVFVTIRTLVRKWRAQTVADYPDLPRNVRELLQITI